MAGLDQIINRRNTSSYKWDIASPIGSRKELLPFWVADMDFACPEVITCALEKRIAHPVYGYTRRSEGFVDSILKWLNEFHGWEIPGDWLNYSPPGVIQAIHNLIQLLSGKEDGIIVQTPAYGPLLNVVRNNGRRLLENRLMVNDGMVGINFTDLEKKAEEAKLMILCSPHNPTGRVWTSEELVKISEVCLRNNVFLISDEIHADFVFRGSRHIHYPSLSRHIAENSACCISASKTFNISGLPHSTVILANKKIRDAYNELVDTTQTNLGNLFSEIATEAGYSGGRSWLDQVLDYTRLNMEFVISFLDRELPGLGTYIPEGTYMMWIDFTKLGLAENMLMDILVKEAGILLAPGSEFGISDGVYFRLNVACPLEILSEGLNRMAGVLRAHCD